MRPAPLAALVRALPSAAEDFDVDPEAGSASGDGSATPGLAATFLAIAWAARRRAMR